MPIWSREAEDDTPMTSVLILLDTLLPAERQDLANVLLRAAWSATLPETRIFLHCWTYSFEIDNASPGGVA